ncbi:SPFH domain-containing protein [Aquihabitans sp. McL0605]|uniref:SPFH domain-containing protein n=1 Tax=Aquihabitans sp. McL0605 TaxID=3415671 RepID=UPI003CF28A22
MSISSIVILAVVALIAYVLLKSVHKIGPAEVGLVNKRVSVRKLRNDNPVAFKGEAGYQATLLMPGLRVRVWPIFAVTKFPWVQIPAGEIGVVIAQVGGPVPIGAKSAEYDAAFGNFSDLSGFVNGGGQKGVQRPVLPPGTLVPLHPVAFMVIGSRQVFGLPVSPELVRLNKGEGLTPESFGLDPRQLQVVVIAPSGGQDVVGIVTTLEGQPLESGDIASRLGGFQDIETMEQQPDATDAELIDTLLGSKNDEHNNYQDFQKFLDAGGRIGLQHDPLQYGAYLLNPFLVRVDMVPMLVVNQGEVAVIKGFVGLPTLDTSGSEFKFGSIVRPGHRGIWQEPLRTGKYPINPRVYAAEIVPTFILTLNWSTSNSQAHDLDSRLEPIIGKSREGFVFTIDLQVQIHVSDTRAPKVISMVGTMVNLVNEVLQSAVGNHFRNTLQALEAVQFIETRQAVQRAALEAVTQYLSAYEVETRGVYIQDVVFPEELVEVLTRREIANQERATFVEQQKAETARIETEKAKGTADMQSSLARSAVSVDINRNEAQAREAQASGEAAYVRLTGEAEADKLRAIGLAEAKATEALGVAKATGYDAQREAIGEMSTALVAVAGAIGEGGIDIMPEVLVTGGGGSFEGLAATLMQALRNGTLTNGSGNGDGRRRTEVGEALAETAQEVESTMEPLGSAEPPAE